VAVVRDMEFGTPPIWEVGISAWTASPITNAYEVRDVHDLFRERFPEWERQPAFTGYQPFPPRNGPMGTHMGMPIMMMGAPAQPTRFWFLSEAGSDLLQIQENFIARNWRKFKSPFEDPMPYPGYDVLRRDFEQLVESLRNYTETQDRLMPGPVMCELLYDNMIPLLGPDGARLKTSEATTAIREFSKPVTNFNAGWFENIADGDPSDGATDFQVALQVVGAPVSSGAIAPHLKLMFVARSSQQSWDAVFQFLDDAHSHVRKRLVELTTESVRALWN
jgi:uncharacterized protein (TIGR04255 family)